MGQKVELHGHLIFPGSVELSPSNEGTYAFTLTLSYTPSHGVSAMSTRTGVVVPRPGSTPAEVHAVLAEWMISVIGGQSGGHVVLFRDLTPNDLFVQPGEYVDC